MDHPFAARTRMRGKAMAPASGWHELQRDRHRPRRSPGWQVSGAILALLAMLLVFHYVVRGSVRQSESRYKAAAMYAQAIWRCNNLQDREVSDSCRLRVNAEARRVALLRFQGPP